MDIENKIRTLATNYATRLNQQVDERVRSMENDDTSHFLIYQVLGISDQEGRMIDIYQNKGRFLYRYAGSFLEDAAKLCFQENFPEHGSARIPNTRGQRPKTFQIDCLVDTDAIEIKWRDATTDGDHITKEHTRILCISDHGYTPIRVMFYYPNRDQAIRIQQILETVYNGINGQYYYGDSAWEYIRNRTDVDLLAILTDLAGEYAGRN